ncbi:glycoside hydrolase family 32 protein [Paenibacillus mucilaginosus]|uniref:SacC2 n=3 Tax=Paenibacillus mucilaginosus TaxID=61624 RepID=H6NJB8_9BACL|nr:glycoside hydrolase family 32 protein [Paenibacillus mucilaginosus]AEI40576.1 SacC2 [Paenibacillus mucilaginosus KNP414]AFC29197.1 SacC2 [Paenibacillus mucilaginosus 3016]AFH61370.2 protein SacC [Paenibacillus mucilaginosus K02]MCG7216292.1 glycoside hydrolase family 32 protein [Paenibacillus mucilaginosus]WDM29731.1 glycoside hydrolase family 32 protein [Paenibacillus mucilaginosus]
MNATPYLEKYRSQFHFTPPANWMNDPNGMVYWDGEYHLFYQYHPGGTTWGPMHWGHAVSTDLTHWEHLPMALKPDRHGQIFSGCAVVDWEDSSGFFAGSPGLVAVFTHADQHPDTDRPRQRQSLAYSLDKGRTWTMYDGNPVLSHEQLTDFRDPKVFWYAPNRTWVMVIAAGDRVLFYTSPDLKAWAYASEFGAEEGSHDGVWECPDLIELPVDGQADRTRWVLIVSIGDRPECPEGSRTQYFVGSFDGSRFTSDAQPEAVLWLDHGRDNYAGVTWSDANRADGGRLFIGWMSNWKYANLTPTDSWRSAMTLPRVMSLKTGPSGVRLVQEPVSGLQKLRREERQWENVPVTPGINILSSEKSGTFEIECELELGSATEVGLKLRQSESEETVVGYNASAQTLFIDRTRSGETGFHAAFGCRHEAPLEAREGRLKLRLFVDHASVEVFANDGELVMTDQIFPDPGSTGLELYALGGEARLISLRLYELNSVYSAVTAGI